MAGVTPSETSYDNKYRLITKATANKYRAMNRLKTTITLIISSCLLVISLHLILCLGLVGCLCILDGVQVLPF